MVQLIEGKPDLIPKPIGLNITKSVYTTALSTLNEANNSNFISSLITDDEDA
jgi:hypothetical protein